VREILELSPPHQRSLHSKKNKRTSFNSFKKKMPSECHLVINGDTNRPEQVVSSLTVVGMDVNSKYISYQEILL